MQGRDGFVGHPIATIVSTPEAAMDGASCVEVTYEQLPLSDIEIALQKDASGLAKWNSRDESDGGDHAEVEQ